VIATTSSLDEFPEEAGGGVLVLPAGAGEADATADCGGFREHMGAAHVELTNRRREKGNMCNMLERMSRRRAGEQKVRWEQRLCPSIYSLEMMTARI
jgi:hypothetical protein